MEFTYQRKIYGYECDVYGHLNNSNYLQVLEAARAEVLIDVSLPIAWLKERGIAIFVKHIDIEYIKPVELEDVVTVKTTIEKLNRVKGIWRQLIINEANEICAEALVTAVFTKNGLPARMDNELINKFKQ